MSLLNVHTAWGRLQEVWLGDVYPASWYDHLDSETRDCFHEITEITKQDLGIIERKLQEFGVIVRRPQYNSIDDYIGTNPASPEELVKPMITPRDYFLVCGNTFYGAGHWKKTSWENVLAEYAANPANCVSPIITNPIMSKINSANTVQCGRDIYIDHNLNYHGGSKEELVKSFKDHCTDYFKDYRTHMLFNGGHIDGCFSILKPGVLMTSSYFDDYERTFPGWKQINISQPEFLHHKNAGFRPGPRGTGGKWWMPGMEQSNAFNEYVLKHARDWIGDYTETYFEVNCLVIDEKNVLTVGENEAVFRELEKQGITAHPMPFRTRTFWDGGLHCITLDIRRQDSTVDLFPERGDQSLFVY
jgi:hypothetical protein